MHESTHAFGRGDPLYRREVVDQPRGDRRGGLGDPRMGERSDCVDRDTVPCEVERRDPGEGDQSALRAPVARLTSISDQSGARYHVDDPTPETLAHLGA